jgi:hypothetical protein
MQIEPFGFVVLLAGIFALVLDYRWTIYFGYSFTLLGGAAALLLPALGGATITPPTLFLGFIVVKALTQGGQTPSTLEFLSLKRPGGWLAFVVCYGILAAFIAPGLFPETAVYSIGHREGTGAAVVSEYLQYGSGQMTQGVYAIGGVVLFNAAVSLLRQPDAWNYVFRAFVVCTVLNLVFAGLDVLSYNFGYVELLDFIRTANYAQLYSGTVGGGVKRIVGSFPEAAAFASYSCALLGFWASLWMQHFRPRISGPMAFCTLAALLFSTSSTAYLAVFILFAIFAARDILAVVTNRRPQRLGFILASAPLVLFFALVFILVNQEAVDRISGVLDETLFNKVNTASGIERFAWNTQAWQGMIDTYGVGVGIGGGRASSYLFVLLNNVGLIGTICFAVFVCKTLSVRNFRPSSDGEEAIGSGCRWALAAGLISSAISAAVFELGVMMYLTAAAAAAIGFRQVGPAERRPAISAPRRPITASR